MSLRILVAPSGFKEGIGPREAALAIAAGVLRALPDARVDTLPIIDGGEAFAVTLVELTKGTLHAVRACGPNGKPADAHVGFLGGAETETAIIDVASVAGLRLVPRAKRNMLTATSFGVGELIGKSLDLGAKRILIGCGDSGVNDGGAGVAMALGVRLFDLDGKALGRGAKSLERVHRVDASGIDARVRGVRIDAAVNWHNRLLGPGGVTRVYGPQKEATPEQIEVIERGLERYAAALLDATGVDVTKLPGAGASGGIGATLAGLLGATLHPRFEVVARYLDFDRHLGAADLVITAEGRLDGQSARGKVPAEIGNRARALGIPVSVLAGAIGDGAERVHEHGVTAYTSIAAGPTTLAQAIRGTEEQLAAAAEQMVRLVAASRTMGPAATANSREAVARGHPTKSKSRND
jgi:glycerate kinase